MQARSGSKMEIRFEELFREYFSSLCYFAQKYVIDLDTAREIVHAVYVSIWDKRAEFNFDKSAKSYLFTSVYNRSMNHIRDNKKFKDTDIVAEKLEPSEPDPNHMEAAELESRIWRVINSLPERCREIFLLSRFEDKKYAEIATQLNISVKTVETQISKALKTLRENLSDYAYLILLLILKNL